jgi:transcriptional regulator with XRE-family HTH domain
MPDDTQPETCIETEPCPCEPPGALSCDELAKTEVGARPAATTVSASNDGCSIEPREAVSSVEMWFAELRTLHGSAYLPRTAALVEWLRVHETDHRLDTGRNFGHHVRSLRRVRGMTQEALAERCGLSADTIRRLEHGSFSPSLDTLRKLGHGLDLMMSTLFESFELGARNEARELLDLLSTRTGRELDLATRVLRTLFDELDRLGGRAVPSPLDDEAGPSEAGAGEAGVGESATDETGTGNDEDESG